MGLTRTKPWTNVLDQLSLIVDIIDYMNTGEASSSSSINQVVDEFPAPPDYYKNSAPLDSLTPPVIPNGDPYVTAYSGIFVGATQNRSNFDSNKNYCALLKDQIKVVMRLAIGLISSANLDENKTRFEAVELRAELSKFHELLSEYRVHEAREVYIKDLKDQIAQMSELEEKLRRYGHCVAISA